ncbi:hypothetical protein [Arthrobacter sp. ES1]|uniref:hypothetical protein n=1 Tax=Arthrobacter sp. ES1 TaxID=1897056 RepID=UPI001CFF6BE8|nr:hypothetical protein [Arthrobacter sp. ES1]MCB5280335.1 hypothetical protein [Arthrobacter sp. ES1]
MTTTPTEAAPQIASGFPTTPLFDRHDGTFFKPSPSSTAEHCIGFWSNVAIPDEIITQLETAYYQTRLNEVQKQVDDQVEAWAQQWITENPKPKRESHVAEWNARFAVDREAFMGPLREGLQKERPMRLDMYDSRQLVRAAQMMYHIPSHKKFPVEENLKVRDHQIELYNEVLTVEEIQTRYRFLKIHYCLERIFKDNTMGEMLEEMRTMNSVLGVTRDMMIEAQRVQNY